MRVGGMEMVIGQALDHYDGKPERAESALSLLRCHDITDGPCKKLATQLCGDPPYDCVPMCEEHGEPIESVPA